MALTENAEKEAPTLARNPFKVICRIYVALRSKMARCLPASAPPHPDKNVYLPADIRQTFQGTDRLEKENLCSLIESSPWLDEASYLVLKALDKDVDTQMPLLADLAQLYRSNAENTAVQNRLFAAHKNLRADTEVVGGKLLQISRHGPHAWGEHMRDLARQIYKDGVIPCLIAYSSLSGLRQFVQECPERGHLLIAIKHRLQSNQNNGLYVLSCEKQTCTMEEWDRERHGDSIPEIGLCDDTIRSGQTLDDVRRCLVEKELYFPRIGEKNYCMTHAGSHRI